MKKLTTEKFIICASLKHKNFYKYTNSVYTTSRNSIIITCPLHGDFLQKANNHLNGAGCTKCKINKVIKSRVLTLESFVIRANIIHKFKYNYTNSIYINNRIKINIHCPVHGNFLQVPDSHLNGNGCSKCAYSEFNGGWKMSQWKISGELSKNFESFKVYIIKCWNENEEFYKIGRTFVSVKDRFKYKLPYNYKILKIIEGTADYIYNLENKLKTNNNQHKYIPLKKFGGNNECFKQLNNVKLYNN